MLPIRPSQCTRKGKSNIENSSSDSKGYNKYNVHSKNNPLALSKKLSILKTWQYFNK